MKQCSRPGCSESVEDHLLACRDDWFELTIPLRNKINLAYNKMRRSGGRHGKGAYQRALIEAIRAWDASAVVIARCHRCSNLTDLDEVLEDGTTRPVCLSCFKIGLNTDSQPPPIECSSCGQPTEVAVSFSDRPPHLCLDCAPVPAA